MGDDFCEPFEKAIGFGYILINPDGAWVIGSWRGTSNVIPTAWSSGEAEIKYCPFCGRGLREASNE